MNLEEVKRKLFLQKKDILVKPCDFGLRVRIIALKSGQDGKEWSYEIVLNSGMEHVEKVLSECGYQVIGQPTAFQNREQGTTTALWVYFKRCDIARRVFNRIFRS